MLHRVYPSELIYSFSVTGYLSYLQFLVIKKRASLGMVTLGRTSLGIFLNVGLRAHRVCRCLISHDNGKMFSTVV